MNDEQNSQKKTVISLLGQLPITLRCTEFLFTVSALFIVVHRKMELNDTYAQNVTEILYNLKLVDSLRPNKLSFINL